MKLRKLIALALASLMILAMFAGCAKEETPSKPSPQPSTGGETPPEKPVQPDKPAEKVKFTFWNSGSDNVRQMFDKLVEDFNTNYETAGQYECEMQFVLSGTGGQSLADRMIAAKKAGQTSTDFDMIEVGENDIVNYLNQAGEDIFIELDRSKIPNWTDDIPKVSFAEGSVMPYRGTTVVLAYNSETVTDVPTSFDEVIQWIKDHPGRFAYNPPASGGAGSSFVQTAVYNFLPEEALTSSDPKWVEQWGQGLDLLKEIHPYMYQSGGKVMYPNKNQGSMDLLANKEVDMIPAWADMMLSQMKQGTMPDCMKITSIENGFTGSFVVHAMPIIGNPDHREAGYAWLNYMLTPEAQNMLLDGMAAIPLIDKSKLDPELLKTVDALDVNSFRLSSLGELSKQLNTTWDEQIATLG